MKAAGGHSFYYIFLDHGLPRNIKSNNDAKSTMVPIEAHRSNLDLPVAGSAFFVLSQWQFFKGGWNVRWRNNDCPFPDSGRLDLRLLLGDFRWQMGTFRALCYNGKEIAEIFL